MKKSLLVAAALAAASAFTPVVVSSPAQAASAYPSKCLILPLLQPDCRAAIKDGWDKAAGAPKAAVVTASTTVKGIKLPMWIDCEPAAKGAGHLYDCK